MTCETVIPAKAGTQFLTFFRRRFETWVPAFAGMTVLLLVCSVHVTAAEPRVKESFRSLSVTVVAPMPEEIENMTQGRALCREAAVVQGQTAILKHVLHKKARSGKRLSEAEVPSIELQNHIRGYVQGAQVKKTTWKKDGCEVTLRLRKSELRKMLRKN